MQVKLTFIQDIQECRSETVYKNWGDRFWSMQGAILSIIRCNGGASRWQKGVLHSINFFIQNF